jgi:hypothetical protein
MEKATTGDGVHDHIRGHPKTRTPREGTDYPFQEVPTRHREPKERS